MKAALTTKYGSPDVLEIRNVDKPSPKDSEVLIKIHSVPVTMGDCEVRASRFPLEMLIPLRLILGIRKPKNPIQGAYLSGVIEEVGKNINNFQVGDEVFGTTGLKLGANAEYTCLSAKCITTIPQNISFEEAATIGIGGLNALHFIRKANIQSNEKIVINGAGGSIGTFAIQLAKLSGAEVTAIDSNNKLNYLKSIGADRVIDYNEINFTKENIKYDIIFDIIGKSKFEDSIGCLNKNGRYILANPRLINVFKGIWTSITTDKKVIFQLADEKIEDMDYLKELMNNGQIKTHIDKTYSLEDIAKAHTYVENGYKKGDVVLKIV